VEIDGGLVAKVAHRPIGLRDNEIELRVYRRADAQLRDLLCPVLHLSPGGAVLARRCLPLSASPGDLTVSDTIRRLAGAGISDAAANLGLLDGRIVCYDYAQISARLLSFVAR
jgi:hypothetical protein